MSDILLLSGNTAQEGPSVMLSLKTLASIAILSFALHFFISGVSAVAAANSDALAPLNAIFGRFGYNGAMTVGKTCQITMTLDESAFIHAVPEILEAKLLNPEVVTQTMVNAQPTVLSMVFAMDMASSAIQQAYSGNTSISKCTFKQTIVETDDYGHDKSQTMFTFNFTRELNNKINWDKFDNTKLMKIAPQFRLDPILAQQAAQEHAASE